MVAGIYLVSCTLWCGWGIYVLVKNPPGSQSPFTRMGALMIVTAPIWPLVAFYQIVVGARAVLSYLSALQPGPVLRPRPQVARRAIPSSLSTTLPSSWW